MTGARRTGEKKIKRLLIIWLVLSAPASQAEMYRWVDENGQVHYSDSNPGDAETYSPPESNVADPFTQGSGPPTIRIYTAEWCSSCKRAKRYMQEKGIAFVEYDIEKDPHGRNEFRMLGGRGVPLITVGDQKMQGFTPARFEQMLRKIETAD